MDAVACLDHRLRTLLQSCVEKQSVCNGSDLLQSQLCTGGGQGKDVLLRQSFSCLPEAPEVVSCFCFRLVGAEGLFKAVP